MILGMEVKAEWLSIFHRSSSMGANAHTQESGDIEIGCLCHLPSPHHTATIDALTLGPLPSWPSVLGHHAVQVGFYLSAACLD